jgi:hypothetical protein
MYQLVRVLMLHLLPQQIPSSQRISGKKIQIIMVLVGLHYQWFLYSGVTSANLTGGVTVVCYE